MKTVLDDIRSGRFAEEFVGEVRGGGAKFDELRRKGKEHQIEQVGSELRAMMPWISAGKAKVELALAKGKKAHDKRETIKTRDWNREKQRLLRNNG